MKNLKNDGQPGGSLGSSWIHRLNSWWRRTLFNVSGFIACAVRGELGKYSYLLAQANLESGNLKSNAFIAHRNAFGMHWPMVRPTPATHGEPGDGGMLAVYRSYWDAWQCRLNWEEKFNPGRASSVSQWGSDLVLAGYNPSPAYPAALAKMYNQGNWFPKLFDQSTLLGRMAEAWGPTARKVVSVAFIFGLLALVWWLIYLLRSWNKGSSKRKL